MLGYMTKKEAVNYGFTNHGFYWFIPVWISDEEFPVVAAKWKPMELLFTVVSRIEGLISFMMGKESGFRFYIGPRI
jgi:uncharacterized protein (DUF779 family)